MAQINYATRTLTCKIVFSGPGLSGKTTNLEHIYGEAAPAQRGELTSIATHGDRTIFYDYMPLELGKVGGLTTRLQLYTVPGQPYYGATRKLILVGVDGIVFVADGQAERLQENARALEELEGQMREMQRDLSKVPLVFQWNKMDLPNAVGAQELDRLLNKYRAPTIEAVAVKGRGVLETLKRLSVMVLEHCQQEYGLKKREEPPATDARRTKPHRTRLVPPKEEARPATARPGGRPIPKRPKTQRTSRPGQPATGRRPRPRPGQAPPGRRPAKPAARTPGKIARAPAKAPAAAAPALPQAVSIPLAGDSSLELEPIETGVAKAPPRSNPSDPALGMSVGGCVIMSRLGEGGMGTVYLARHKTLGKTVVVKTLKPDQVGVENNVKRFFQEARSAAKLEHDNVVKVQDVGTNEQGMHYMVMQYVDGKNLEDLIKESGGIEPREAARIVLEVAKALMAIHSAGVIHRDIKAQNIVVNRDGEVKLIDFGLAKDLNAALRLTQTGGLVGTPAYMAPEMLRSKQIDGRVDIFALGLTFYYMLTAQLPFEGTAIHDLFLGKARLKAPEVFTPDLPEDFRHVLERMLAKELNVRYRDAESLAADLERMLAGNRIGPPPGEFWLWEGKPPKKRERPISIKAETLLIEPDEDADEDDPNRTILTDDPPLQPPSEPRRAAPKPQPTSKPKPKKKKKTSARARPPEPAAARPDKVTVEIPSADPDGSQGDTSLGTKDLVDEELRRELERARREPGNELGTYLLLANLDNEGIGDLYRGWDSQKRRQVAIRVVEGMKRLDSTTGRRLDGLRRLKHPHMVSLLDFGTAAGNFYLVQELIDGEPLGRKKREAQVVAQVLTDVASALRYAHEKKILHGGVQPTSIFVDTDGRGHLLDFGLSNAIARIRGSRRLRMVSARYRPPESLDKEIDARGEVYSVGVVLYTALTGKAPSLKGDSPRPREVDSSIPEGLEAVCLKCLHHEPGERYHSVQALHEDLERCLAGKRPQLSGDSGSWAGWNPLGNLLARRAEKSGASGRHAPSWFDRPLSGRPVWQYGIVAVFILIALMLIATVLTP